MEVRTQPNPAAEHFMHKNRLQEHAQRASIPLPIYTTVNEGSPHAPKLRASVLIDGASFTSPSTFNNRKAAEQEVARVAFEELSRKIKPETIPPIHNDLSYCKSILHEYCAKRKLDRPIYNTCALAGSPAFSYTVIFGGLKYTGFFGRTKKEAEQMAARAVIESVLGSPEARNCMYEIIKSKCKLIAAIYSISGSLLLPDRSMITKVHVEKVHVDNLSTTNVIEKKEEAIVLINDKLPASSYPGQHPNAVPVESSVPEVNELERRSIPEHHSTLLYIGCTQSGAPHSNSGSHLVQDQSMNLKVHLDNLNTTNVVKKKEEAITLTNDKLPASIHPGQPAIGVTLESRLSEVKELEHKCIPEHLSSSLCSGQSIPSVSQTNLSVGANGLCSCEGTRRGSDPSPDASPVVPGILDGSTLGKRKKQNKKKKNKSPSKKIRN